jgi:hypothetical protein
MIIGLIRNLASDGTFDIHTTARVHAHVKPMQQTQRCKARTSRVDTVSRFPTCVLCCVHVPFPVNQIAEDINPTNRDYTMVKQFVYDKHIDHRALNLSFHLTGGRPNTSARAFRRHFEGEWGSFLGGFTDNMRTQIWREL